MILGPLSSEQWATLPGPPVLVLTIGDAGTVDETVAEIFDRNVDRIRATLLQIGALADAMLVLASGFEATAGGSVALLSALDAGELGAVLCRVPPFDRRAASDRAPIPERIRRRATRGDRLNGWPR